MIIIIFQAIPTRSSNGAPSTDDKESPHAFRSCPRHAPCPRPLRHAAESATISRGRRVGACPLELDSTEVLAENLGTRTEGTGAYTTGAMSTATRLPLTIRETPQSVSVVTRQQMDDFKLGTLSEALQQSPGVVVQRLDSERVGYAARGYSIENFQYDGMLNTFSRLKPDSDTIIYDRIEVVRGATGLTTERATLRRR